MTFRDSCYFCSRAVIYCACVRKKSFNLLQTRYKYLQMNSMISGIFFKTTGEVEDCSFEPRAAMSLMLRWSDGYREVHYMISSTLVASWKFSV